MSCRFATVQTDFKLHLGQHKKKTKMKSRNATRSRCPHARENVHIYETRHSALICRFVASRRALRALTFVGSIVTSRKWASERETARACVSACQCCHTCIGLLFFDRKIFCVYTQTYIIPVRLSCCIQWVVRTYTTTTTTSIITLFMRLMRECSGYAHTH